MLSNINIGLLLNYLLPKYGEIYFGNLGRFALSESSNIQVSHETGNDTYSNELLTYIATQKRVSIETAQKELDFLVDDILKTIKVNPEYQIYPIGKLTWINNTIELKEDSFDVSEALKFRVEEENISVPVLELPKEPEFPINEVVQENVHENVQGEEEKEIEQEFVEDEERSTGKIVWISLAAVALVFVATVFYLKNAHLELYNQYLNQFYTAIGSDISNTQDSEPWEAENNILPYEDQQAILLDSLEGNVSDSLELIQNEEIHAQIEDDPRSWPVRYEIVVGSFTTLKQAEKYVEQMKEKGHDFELLESKVTGNRKKVIWGSYKTQEEAKEVLREVQRTFEAGAWIAEIKN